MTSSATLCRELARQIAEHGLVTDPAWLVAVEAVPRELFLPDAMFHPDGTRWEPVRREQLGDKAWLRAVYADTSWATQLDGIDAQEAPGPVSERPTSSSTLPSLVARMPELAEVQDGDVVLEIGTGTGYSTAVLCHRLGAENGYSVEYDEKVAAAAARHLRDAGCSPRLVVGDGLLGHQDGAYYDAAIATCAVRTIPPLWLWQVRDGGSIATTVSGWMLGSGLIRLVLDE
ncbi:methyltransferase domain-containing protein [Streptomyces coelicoflavus]|uniref:methyltransferase domain-containing protein n=1 Tax=Streptomyces coelicoflavus TaxID=285562 RepID=UPI00365D6F0B